jgi:membrane associated rhomboid family serine protease/Zn-dependent protease with chaperone function
LGSPLDAFAGIFEPPRPTFLYTCALAAVAMAMLLLPLAYLSLIGLVAYAVWLHAVHDVAFAFNGFFGLLAYVAPILAGVMLVFFTLKPFLAVRPDPPRMSLDVDSERRLIAFVQRICMMLRAPRPCRIDVNLDANASASPERGLRSLFERRIVLTIGLPLVAGLSMRQFAGVLAHELGHFGQGTGMRLSYVIARINLWFARVVYERDAWDVRLEAWAKSRDPRIAVIVALAHAGVRFTRVLLHGLLRVGRAISGFLLRQMEYDADRCQALLSGSDAFEACLLRIYDLMWARQRVEIELQRSWVDQRLPDDISQVVARRFRKPSAELRAFIDQVLQKTTDRWDTHPAAGDRIRAIRDVAASGVFHVNDAAEGLFADFATLGKEATRFFYEKSRGLSLDAMQLVPSDDFLTGLEAIDRQHQAVLRFFRSAPFAMGALPSSCLALRAPDQLVPIAAEARTRMHRLQSAFADVMKRFTESWTRFSALTLARYLSVIGVPVPAGQLDIRREEVRDVGLPAATIAARNRVSAERDRLVLDLQPLERAAADRIGADLGLLQHTRPQLLGRESSALLEEALRIGSFLNALDADRAAMREVHAGFDAINALTQYRFTQPDDSRVMAQLGEAHRDMAAALGKVVERLGEQPYPIDDGHAGTARGHVMEDRDAGAAVRRLLSLYERCVNRLIEIVDAVEREWLPIDAPVTNAAHTVPSPQVPSGPGGHDRSRADGTLVIFGSNPAAFSRMLLERTPHVPGTVLIVCLNVLIYLAMLGAAGRSFDVDMLLGWGALSGPLAGRGEWWRALTSVGVHAGFLHLLFNMIVLLQVGPFVERLTGSATFVACYVMTGLCASFAGVLIHPMVVSVGASGAVFGMFGMLVSVTLATWRPSVREVVDETVVAVTSYGGAPRGPRSVITTLDLSSAGSSSRGTTLSTPRSTSGSPAPEVESESRESTLRRMYAAVIPLVLINLGVGTTETGIDTAAHVGGLVAGIAIGWLVARDVLEGKPSLLRLLVPAGLTIVIGVGTMNHLAGLTGVRFEVSRFAGIDEVDLTTFTAALTGVQAGRRTPEEVAAWIDDRVLPSLQGARRVSERLTTGLQRELEEASRLDPYGRAREWRRLQPLREQLALATAWQRYLFDREADWRLRADALRRGAPPMMTEASRRDRVAAQRLAAALRGPG